MMWGHQQAYNVIVEILEVQNLVWPIDIALTDKKGKIDAKLPNPLVEVTIKNESYYTDSKEATSSCAFNQTFYFQNMMLDSSEFQRSTVEIRVLNQGFFKQELIGMYTGSFEKIYSLPNHRLLKTLVPITIPERPSIPLGYIRLSIYVLGENDLVAPEDSFGYNDDSVGNILAVSSHSVPAPELAITYYHLNFNVHLARDVLLPDYADLSHQEADGYLPSPFVRIVALDNALETEIIRSSPSPVWNETLKFPVGIPCLDDRIVLELWDAHGGGDGPRLVAQTKLSLQDILQSELGPTWLHFYGQTTGLRGSAIDIKTVALNSFNSQNNGDQSQLRILPATIRSSGFGVLGMFDTKNVTSFPCVAYLGRLLVSASLTRIPNPTPIKTSAQPVEIPKTDPYLFWADIYEVSGLGLPSEVYIELSVGSWSYWVIPNFQKKISDSFPFCDKLGRVPDQNFALPEIDMSSDLLIRIYTKDESYNRPLFHSYIRISANEMLRYSSDRPRWYPLLSAAHYGVMVGQDIPYDEAAALSHIKHYGMLLGSFILRKNDPEKQFEYFIPSLSNIKRPPRINYNLCRWICRAYIFQAIRLPVVESTLPDSLVMVTLGGGTVLTEIIPKTVNPDWHEALVFDAALPDDLSIAQWLNIAVLHEDIVLGSVAISPLYIGFMKKSRPEWFILQTPRTPECKARILCAFELVKIGDMTGNVLFSSISNQLELKNGENDPNFDLINNYKAWSIPDVTPKYVPCDVHLFLIGIRLRNQNDSNNNSIFSLSSTSKPIIQFEFGRDPEKPENRLWVQQATQPILGGDSGNYNYLKSLCLKCHIPASPVFQTYIEIRVLEPVNVFGTKCREFGTSYLHLNHHLPWIEEYHQRSLKTEFQYLPPKLVNKKWLSSGRKFLSKYYRGPWKLWKNKPREILSPKISIRGANSISSMIKTSSRSSLISLPSGEIIENVSINDDCYDFDNLRREMGDLNEINSSEGLKRNEGGIYGEDEDNIINDDELYCGKELSNQKFKQINNEKNTNDHFDDFFDIFYDQSSSVLADTGQFTNSNNGLLIPTDNKFDLGIPNILQDLLFGNNINNQESKQGNSNTINNSDNLDQLKEYKPFDFINSPETLSNYLHIGEEESFIIDPTLNIPIHDLEALNSCISSMEAYIKPLKNNQKNMKDDGNIENINPYLNMAKSINWGIKSQLYDYSNTKRTHGTNKEQLDLYFTYGLRKSSINYNMIGIEENDDFNDLYELDDDENDYQDELNHDYETELDMDELPYDSVPIISANRTGEAEVVGFIKIYCKILSKFSLNINKNKKLLNESNVDVNSLNNTENDKVNIQTPIPKLLPLSSRELKEYNERRASIEQYNQNQIESRLDNDHSKTNKNYSDINSNSSNSNNTRGNNLLSLLTDSQYTDNNSSRLSSLSISQSSSSSFMTKLHNRRFSLSSFDGRDSITYISRSNSLNGDNNHNINNENNYYMMNNDNGSISSEMSNNSYIYDPILEKLKRQILEIPRFKVRVYILTGHGFVPPKQNFRNALISLGGIGGSSGGSNEANWYINVKTGSNTGNNIFDGGEGGNSNISGGMIRNDIILSKGMFEINDSESISKGFSPDFYKSYELDAILPLNALLTITIFHKNNNNNLTTLYGRTYIDIEDRFFHPVYQKMILNLDSLQPIEIRQLYGVGSNSNENNLMQNSVGSLRCWIQVLPPEIAIIRPIYPLNPPTVEICQVRVVIYRLRNIPVSKLVNNTGMSGILAFGEPSISLMVKGLMSPNNNTKLEQDTDTHWNSSDGTAIFNWRFVFNIPVPCHFPILRLQVWNRGLLVFGDAISECSFDLSSYLLRSRKLNSKVNINRTLINMSHPARPNEKRGEMEIEISILPLSLAESSPVGIGREEPNKDPYLPDVTDHRNYITTSAFGKGFFSATSNVKWGAKLMTWLITAVVIITILSLLIKLFK
ncbi:ferlin like type II membrane associated protein [Cryptosporidium ubiquitum]|uniref:Ferlin like type II membrane associated protein n=1 Tax=Cryptosporidium ubiquitum TaxID=857276 RepID=A0A1J4MB72_9CRYT|nr:ferlin like type II membrane associated protein [Cryptosporidium ubiquitum]OII71231.1 ferlin like type II membrane associated protein [Cryptosporidium ubiquitum]